MSTNDRSDERHQRPSGTDRGSIGICEIRVQGSIGTRWASWFDGLALTTEDDGTTVIRGPIVDQAALHGLLQKLRDLGIPLLSLTSAAPAGLGEQLDLSTDRPHPNPPGATS